MRQPDQRIEKEPRRKVGRVLNSSFCRLSSLGKKVKIVVVAVFSIVHQFLTRSFKSFKKQHNFYLISE